MAMATTEETELAATKNSGRRCFCGFPLTFEPRAAQVKCWCERCERRAEYIPGVISCYGYGATEDAALAAWLESQRSM